MDVAEPVQGDSGWCTGLPMLLLPLLQLLPALPRVLDRLSTPLLLLQVPALLQVRHWLPIPLLLDPLPPLVAVVNAVCQAQSQGF